MVCRHDKDEQDTSREPCGDGLSINDGAWVKHGDREVHGAWSHRAHGMRGDRLGVRDIGEVQCGTWGGRDSTCCDDCRRSGSECDAGLECGRRERESNAGIECGRDRVSIDDGVRNDFFNLLFHLQVSYWADKFSFHGLDIFYVVNMSSWASF